MLVLTLKRQDFVIFLFGWKTMQNIIWIRNRNFNFSKVGTATAANHYGSTTLINGSILSTLEAPATACRAAFGRRASLRSHR
jgi:hypothetical protein